MAADVAGADAEAAAATVTTDRRDAGVACAALMAWCLEEPSALQAHTVLMGFAGAAGCSCVVLRTRATTLQLASQHAPECSGGFAKPVTCGREHTPKCCCSNS